MWRLLQRQKKLGILHLLFPFLLTTNGVVAIGVQRGQPPRVVSQSDPRHPPLCLGPRPPEHQPVAQACPLPERLQVGPQENN
jgi:hypothetical protein